MKDRLNVIERIVSESPTFSETSYRPFLIGRCFVVILRDPRIEDKMLDGVLMLHWDNIWPMAAREHWEKSKEPLWVPIDDVWQPGNSPAVPDALEKNQIRIALRFWEGEARFSVVISFLRLEVEVEVHVYPEFEELLRVVRTPLATSPDQPVDFKVICQSPTYQVWLSDRKSPKVGLSIANRFVVTMTLSEWQTLKELLMLTLDRVDVRRRCQALKMQYGSGF